MAQIVVTPEGLERLRERLDELGARLASLIAGKGEAAEVGGNVWHDNASFEDLERQERLLRRQIADLRHKLDTATLVDTSREPRGDTVQLNSTVELRYEDGRARVLRIAGHGESDPTAGVISYDAPLARALLGSRLGDTITVTVGARSHAVVVQGVS